MHTFLPPFRRRTSSRARSRQPVELRLLEASRVLTLVFLFLPRV